MLWPQSTAVIPVLANLYQWPLLSVSGHVLIPSTITMTAIPSPSPSPATLSLHPSNPLSLFAYLHPPSSMTRPSLVAKAPAPAVFASRRKIDGPSLLLSPASRRDPMATCRPILFGPAEAMRTQRLQGPRICRFLRTWARWRRASSGWAGAI